MDRPQHRTANSAFALLAAVFWAAVFWATPAVATPPPQASLGQTLEAVLQASPRIREVQAMAAATAAEAGMAWQPPDLRVLATWLPQPMDTLMGRQVAEVSVMQDVPFPVKLAYRSDAAHARLRAAEAELDAAVRDVAMEATAAYAELWYADRALDVLSAAHAATRALAATAARRREEMSAPASAWLRAETLAAQLEVDVQSLTQRRSVWQARINALAARPASAPIHPARELPIPAVDGGVADWLARADASRPELVVLHAREDAAAAALQEAHWQWAPDLSIGAMAMINQPAAMPGLSPQSGQDVFSLSLGLTFPLWGRAASETARAEAELEAVRQAARAERHGLEADLEEARWQLADAERLEDLYSRLLPQAEQAFARAEQLAAADPGMWGDWAEGRATLTGLMLSALRAHADRVRAHARLQQLVGAPLAAGAAP